MKDYSSQNKVAWEYAMKYGMQLFVRIETSGGGVEDIEVLCKIISVTEYELWRETKLGWLIANRELPVLMRAKDIISKEKNG